jgi:hypothetical protein
MPSNRFYSVATLALVSAVLGCSHSSSSHSTTGVVTTPPALTLTSVTPTSGTTAGGTQVTLSGTGFIQSSLMTVLFGSAKAQGIVVISSTTLTCDTPLNQNAGTVTITVETAAPSNLSATLQHAFTFQTPSGGGGGGPPGGGPTPQQMTITNISPATGPQSGFTVVTITGTNFAQITSVTFGGSAAAITNVTSTSISVTTVAHAAGQVNVTVSSSFNLPVTDNNGFTYQPNGTGINVTNISPPTGPYVGGNVIDIVGSGFAGIVSVTFSGVQAPSVTIASTTSIGVTVPAGTLIAGFTGGPVNVTVTSSVNGSYSLGGGYTYGGSGGSDVLTAISPNNGPQSGGTKVSISGNNFLNGQNSNVSQVLIGGEPLLNMTVLNASTIAGNIPPGVNPTGASVIAYDANNLASNPPLTFTYTPSLFIDTINPNDGPAAGGGKTVTITGAYFTSTNITSVMFGANPGTTVTVVDSSTLTVFPPASTNLLQGPVDVTIVGNGIASATLHNGYNYGQVFNPVNYFKTVPSGGVAVVGTVLAAQFVPTAPSGAAVIMGNAVAVIFSAGSPPVTITPPSGSSFYTDVAIADLNADGFLDMILLDQGTGNLEVYINNGLNTGFNAPAIVPLTGGAFGASMALGILANNGVYSVAVAERNPDQVEVFKGTLSGSAYVLTHPATTTTALPTNSFACQIQCADPNASTTDPKQYRHPGNMPDAYDMNNDGLADFVVALSQLNQVAVLLQNASAPFSWNVASVTTLSGCVQPALLELADVNNDGSLDVVTGNTGTSNISVLLGDGAGGISVVGSYSVPGQSAMNGIVIGDYNRDCRPDIVTSNQDGESIAILLGHGDGTFADPVTYDGENSGNYGGANIVGISHDLSFNNIVALDENLLQNADILTFVPRSIYVTVLGDIIAPPYAQEGAQQDPEAIAFGDLTHDGHNDMVVANRTSGTIQVFLNDGTGNFTQPYSPVVTGQYPESIAIADVNNDGKKDVLVACNGSDAVFVHINLGGGSLTGGAEVSLAGPGNITSGQFGPHQVIAADMDGTGNVSFVTANQFGDSVSIFTNPNGLGNFVAAGNLSPGEPLGCYPVGSAPLSVAVADISGINKLDIVTANSNADSVTVLLRSAATGVGIAKAEDFALGGTILPAASEPAGTPPVTILVGQVEPVSVALVDLNQDGFIDIVTADKGSSTLTILYGGKGGTAGNFFVPTDYVHYGTSTKIGFPPIKLVTGTNPISVVAADMNVDGKPDLVVGCFGGSEVMDFINQGDETQAEVTGPGDLNLMPPSPSVVPFPGEAAFFYDATKDAILYSSGKLISFTATNTVPVTGMAVAPLVLPCVPNVGTTGTDGNVRLFTVQ